MSRKPCPFHASTRKLVRALEKQMIILRQSAALRGGPFAVRIADMDRELDQMKAIAREPCPPCEMGPAK